MGSFIKGGIRPDLVDARPACWPWSWTLGEVHSADALHDHELQAVVEPLRDDQHDVRRVGMPRDTSLANEDILESHIIG